MSLRGLWISYFEQYIHIFEKYVLQDMIVYVFFFSADTNFTMEPDTRSRS